MPLLTIFPDSKRTSTCRSCGAVITWAVLASGKWMPFDGSDIAELPTQGELIAAGGRRKVHVDPTHSVSHFVTCPDAKKWTRRGRK